MSVTRAYTYLGPMAKVGYKVAIGTYTIAAGDLYDRNARPTLTFSMFSNIAQVLGVYSSVVANTALPVAVVSVATNVVTFAVLEAGGAGNVFPEKTDDEAYGQAYTFFVAVAGL